jgi:hypothetical protein
MRDPQVELALGRERLQRADAANAFCAPVRDDDEEGSRRQPGVFFIDAHEGAHRPVAGTVVPGRVFRRIRGMMRSAMRSEPRGRVLVLVILVACDGSPAPNDGGMSGGEVGDPCAADSDCEGEAAMCLTTSTMWPAFEGGYCSRMPGCSFGEACSEGSVCAPNPGHGPYCFDRCDSDADCRTAEGYTCQTHPFVDATVCLPAP